MKRYNTEGNAFGTLGKEGMDQFKSIHMDDIFSLVGDSTTPEARESLRVTNRFWTTRVRILGLRVEAPPAKEPGRAASNPAAMNVSNCASSIPRDGAFCAATVHRFGSVALQRS